MTTNLPIFTITVSTINTRISNSNSIPFVSFPRSSFLPLRPPFPFPPRFSSLPTFSSGNGNGGVPSETGGGGGDGGGDDADSKLLSGDADDATTLLSTTDVIILDVQGMTCTGCSASVKRILETQEQVSHANVDLASETAVVWPVAEAKITPNWRDKLGEALAKHLTTCGFSSKVKVP